MKSIRYIRNLSAKMMMLLFPVYLGAQGLQSTAGIQITVTDSLKIVFNDAGFINNGGFRAGNSSVIFTGSSLNAQPLIGGSHSISFHQLEIDRAINDVQMYTDIQVNESVFMNRGNLQLNNHTLDLGRTGYITGEKNNSRIAGINGGRIKKTILLNAPQAVNPGNIGVEINSNANLGETVIIRGHEKLPGFSGRAPINRYFDIIPQWNNRLQATLTFHFLDAELDTTAKNELVLFSNEGNLNQWTLLGKDLSDVNRIIKTNISQLNRFTLAGAVNQNLVKKGKTYIQVFPNPATNWFTILVVSNSDKKVVLNLYDAAGRLLEQKNENLRPGANTISWDIGKYPSGTYHLLFNDPYAETIQVIRL